MEALYGKEVADILAQIEFQELQAELKEILQGKHPEDTKLHLNLKNRNPDDGMTTVAYIKGAFFLKTLEVKVGREKLDRFLKEYFTKNMYKSVSSFSFVNELESMLLAPNKLSFDYDEWIYEKGLPSNCLIINSPRLRFMESFANRFIEGEDIFAPKISYEWLKLKNTRKKKRVEIREFFEKEEYIVQEWQTFIRTLSQKNITIPQLQYLDSVLNFSTSNNAEIASEWFVLNINCRNKEIRPNIEKFIAKVGRRKYLMPIYEALVKNPEDKVWAKNVFDKSKAYYHAVSRNSIAELFKD